MEQTQTNDYLERESLSGLMRKYAIEIVPSYV